jgi:hypothetical protein
LATFVYRSEGFVDFVNGCPAKERKAGVEAAPHSFRLWWGDWKSIDSGSVIGSPSIHVQLSGIETIILVYMLLIPQGTRFLVHEGVVSAQLYKN